MIGQCRRRKRGIIHTRQNDRRARDVARQLAVRHEVAETVEDCFSFSERREEVRLGLIVERAVEVVRQRSEMRERHRTHFARSTEHPAKKTEIEIALEMNADILRQPRIGVDVVRQNAAAHLPVVVGVERVRDRDGRVLRGRQHRLSQRHRVRAVRRSAGSAADRGVTAVADVVRAVPRSHRQPSRPGVRSIGPQSQPSLPVGDEMQSVRLTDAVDRRPRLAVIC